MQIMWLLVDGVNSVNKVAPDSANRVEARGRRVNGRGGMVWGGVVWGGEEG